jgi:hypothetical protein
VEWEGWEGEDWDTWEPEDNISKGLRKEMQQAKATGWVLGSWREWLEQHYLPAEVERRTVWKGRHTEQATTQMAKDYWAYAEAKGGGQAKAEARRQIDRKPEAGRKVRRSEGRRSLYLTGLSEDWSYGHSPEAQGKAGTAEAMEWVDWEGDQVLRTDLTGVQRQKEREHPLMRIYVREESMEEAQGGGLGKLRGGGNQTGHQRKGGKGHKGD